MVDQLDLLIGSVVSNTVVDHHVEAIPPTPHVDRQGDGVSHVNRAGDPGASQAVAGTDLHEALGRRKCEHHRVGSVSSACEVGEGTWKDTSQLHKTHGGERGKDLHIVEGSLKEASLFTVRLSYTFVALSERIGKGRGLNIHLGNAGERE